MSEAKKCARCSKEFGIFRWRHTCDYCNHTFCSTCRSHTIGSAPLCIGCYATVNPLIATMIVVRSGHVGQHETTTELGSIKGAELRSLDEAKENVKYLAVKKGANAILNYHYIKGRGSESTDSGGTYYYSTYTGTGDAVVVVKSKRRTNPKAHNKRNEGSVAEELSRLAELHEKGLLDEREFRAAKEKILS